LDPLDPLTEIVRSGQAFSPFIFIERLIWLMIGFFFIGAMTTGIKNNMGNDGNLTSRSSFMRFNKKDVEENNTISKEGEDNINKN